MVIEPYDNSKLDGIVRLSLRAWEPVFKSLEHVMGPAVYRAFYRDDWRAAQRRCRTYGRGSRKEPRYPGPAESL